MGENSGYYVVKKKALPEVLLKVVETQALLRTGKAATIQEAVERTGISRSSFYKYKDDIFPFHENNRGKTINLMLQLDNEPGVLSEVLNEIAKEKANILTIHQSIPLGGIASITLGIEILPETCEVSEMIDSIEAIKGVSLLKILGRE